MQKIIDFVKTWIPKSDRVVVLPDKKEIDDSGLYTSDTKQGEDKRPTGTVLAVGSGRKSENNVLIEPTSKVGDRVLIGKYSGDDFVIDENLHVERYDKGVVREGSLLVCVLREDSILNTLPSS